MESESAFDQTSAGWGSGLRNKERSISRTGSAKKTYHSRTGGLWDGCQWALSRWLVHLRRGFH